MAQKTLTARLILRNDTKANWEANNPVLLKGEIGLETDTNIYKVGDGINNWLLLPNFANLSVSERTSLDTLIQMLTNDEFGKVDDVQVNDTSVLDSETKTAKIVIGALSYTTGSQEIVSRETFTGDIVLHKVAKTGSYNDLLDKLNVVDNIDSTSTTDVLSANQGRVLKAMIQALPTAESYTTIQDLVTGLNSATAQTFNLGNSLYIVQTGVPDFWVSDKLDTSVPYTYTTDDAFVSDIQTNGSVQVGYYKVSLLETAKVDLSNYYTKAQVDGLLANIDLSNYVTIDTTQTITGVKKHQNKLGMLNDSSFIVTDSDVTGIANANGHIFIGKNIGRVPSNSFGAIKIGQNSTSPFSAGAYSVAVGASAGATGERSVAIGNSASATRTNGIQIGAGMNQTANSLQVGIHQLLDISTGKVPNARLDDAVMFDTDTFILDGGNSEV